MDALLAHGRPATMELAVLVDRRFRRELPIEPQYVGRKVDSLDSQRVKVIWAEEDGTGEDRVQLINPSDSHG
jgi:pyrimidine operon attenuation protein/uracil phosphoribosyltransferase